MSTTVEEALIAGLVVGNVPNPIRSEHTTTFRVEGSTAELVQAIRVDIYDLTGHLVWTEEADAKELQWHTNDFAGNLLSNGVYLYRVWVKVSDIWVSTGVKKLAVVR